MKINTIIPQIPNTKKIFREMNKCFKKKYLSNDGENLLKFERKLQEHFKSKLRPIRHLRLLKNKISLTFQKFTNFFDILI